MIAYFRTFAGCLVFVILLNFIEGLVHIDITPENIPSMVFSALLMAFVYRKVVVWDGM